MTARTDTTTRRRSVDAELKTMLDRRWWLRVGGQYVDVAQPVMVLAVAPADQFLPGSYAQGSRAEANQCTSLVIFHRDIAHDLADKSGTEPVFGFESPSKRARFTAMIGRTANARDNITDHVTHHRDTAKVRTRQIRSATLLGYFAGALTPGPTQHRANRLPYLLRPKILEGGIHDYASNDVWSYGYSVSRANDGRLF